MAEKFSNANVHPIRKSKDLGPAGDLGDTEGVKAAPKMSGKPVTAGRNSDAPKQDQSKRHPTVSGGKGGSARAPK